MDGQIFLGWLKINISFFIAAFIVSLLLAFLFPDTMLGFVRGWGEYSRTAGPIVLEQTSKGDLFVNILAKNSFNTILYFIASLFFLAPLIAAMIGIFYSLGLMSAADHFMKGEIWYPLWSSPVLISIEVSFILLTITFALALGAEIFGVKPERGEIMDFWRENWKRLSPEQKRDWRVVLKENKKEIILFTVIIFALILFGVWFETSI